MTSLAQAHAANEQPWEPLPGMSKLRCTDCRFLFAAPDPDVKRCPDCELAWLKAQRALEQGGLTEFCNHGKPADEQCSPSENPSYRTQQLRVVV